MLLVTHFVHMPRSTLLEKFAEEKIFKKLDQFEGEPVKADITFICDKEKEDHTIKINLKGIRGENLYLEQKAENLYDGVNKLSKRLKTILRKKKEKKLVFNRASDMTPFNEERVDYL
ncbi:MAG: HPF/RaiA family ribosome-associated protein [Oligoflexales bacterium]|nr:HPF/RaiA family ribosome-associated protein [Oligoflexales bacterium]